RSTDMMLGGQFVPRRRRCRDGRDEARGTGVPASALMDPALQENMPIPSRVRQGGFPDCEVTSLIELAGLIQLESEVDGNDREGSEAVHELVQRVAVLIQRNGVRRDAHLRVDHLVTSSDVLLIQQL